MFVAGREQHQMDLVIESYGGEKPKSQEQKASVQGDAEDIKTQTSQEQTVTVQDDAEDVF